MGVNQTSLNFSQSSLFILILYFFSIFLFSLKIYIITIMNVNYYINLKLFNMLFKLIKINSIK